MNNKNGMRLALAAVLSCSLASAVAAQQQVNIYNWYDFIAPDTMICAVNQAICLANKLIERSRK